MSAKLITNLSALLERRPELMGIGISTILREWVGQ